MSPSIYIIEFRSTSQLRGNVCRKLSAFNVSADNKRNDIAECGICFDNIHRSYGSFFACLRTNFGQEVSVFYFGTWDGSFRSGVGSTFLPTGNDTDLAASAHSCGVRLWILSFCIAEHQRGNVICPNRRLRCSVRTACDDAFVGAHAFDGGDYACDGNLHERGDYGERFGRRNHEQHSHFFFYLYNLLYTWNFYGYKAKNMIQ